MKNETRRMVRRVFYAKVGKEIDLFFEQCFNENISETVREK